MPDYQLLNNVDHQNVKVITERSARFGDDVHCVMTFPIEFRRAQTCYPIFFQKDSNNGKLYPIVLFGFEEGKNLFLTDDGWDAEYIPLMVQRHPFLIGYQEDQDAPDGKKPVISIDMNNPRVNESEGEPLFLPHGGTSQYLASMQKTLEDIQFGHQMNEDFIDALLEFDLIESVAMEIELNDGSKRQLLGLYTIDEERLAQLDGDALAKLHEKQYLLSAYMVLASLGRFRVLIDKVNASLPERSDDEQQAGG